MEFHILRHSFFSRVRALSGCFVSSVRSAGHGGGFRVFEPIHFLGGLGPSSYPLLRVDFAASCSVYGPEWANIFCCV